MTEQLSLLLANRAAQAEPQPPRSPLESFLVAHPGWHTCRILRSTASLEAFTDRDLRKMAEESSVIISGQCGYCHIRHASREEVSHAIAWLKSQAGKMVERASRYENHLHN